MENPDDPAHLAALLRSIKADKVLMYSSDYPHFDFDAPTVIARHLPAEMHHRVFHANAARLYGLPLAEPETPAEQIDARIKELPGWRGDVLSRIRHLIKHAEPDVVEEMKWKRPSNSMLGVPTFSHDGLICTGETYQDKVKVTFYKGASLDDPAGLFNASLKGNTRRAIDLHEGDEIDERAFKALVRAAAALNASTA